MKKILLAGNAITAEILLDYLTADSRYEVAGLTVDDSYVESDRIQGLQTTPFSKLEQQYRPNDYLVIMAMGYADLNQSRESMYFRLKEKGYDIETYVHPDALIYTKEPLGKGSVILPSAVLEPHVKLGENSMVWCNATLAHHSTVADHCWIASGTVISGKASVERNSFVGVNATVVNEVVVGQYNIIGGGALITKSTKPSTVHLARSGEELRFSSQDYVKYFGV